MLFALFILLSSCTPTEVASATTHFRSEKMNFIYKKALQHIDDKKRLEKLKSELESFDNIYMDAKKMTIEGKDMTKEYIRIDSKLVDMLQKYDLQQAVQAFKNKKKFRNEYEMENENLVSAGEKFVDPKLKKLWDAALLAKFGEQEMKDLHSDLKQAERKIAEYNSVLEEFNRVPHENSLDHDDASILDEKNQRLKSAHRAMYEHLDDVHRKVTNEEFSPFENPKVKKLWKTAQMNEKLNAHDLEIIKEELLHFDTQLKKLQFHAEELSSVKTFSEQQGKATLQQMEHAELEEKHERMSRKLKKLESYIKDKIRHSEL